MYLIEKYEGREMREKALDPYPFGGGFPATDVAKASLMEVHGSSATDEGPDFCLFKLFDANGELVAERKHNGY